MSIFAFRLPWGATSPSPSPIPIPSTVPTVAPTSSASTALAVVTDVFNNVTNFSPREIFRVEPVRLVVADFVNTTTAKVADVVADVTEISQANATEAVSCVAEVVTNATETFNTTASSVIQVVANATEVVQARGSVFMLPLADITSGAAMAVGVPAPFAKIVGVSAQVLTYVGCAAGAVVLGKKALKEWEVRENGPAAKYLAGTTAALAVVAHQIIATAIK